MNKGILALLVLIVVIGLGAYVLTRPTTAVVGSFADCVAAGYPVMESMPRQCRTPDGRSFVETTPGSGAGTSTGQTGGVTAGLPRVTQPVANSSVGSPLVVTGEAPGTWFFEASLPVSLVDANNRVLITAPAQAQGEWMTTNYVPFRATLAFSAPTTATGFLVVAKDNPSGLPEHDQEIRIPVTFSTPSPSATTTVRACRPTGCSGQICADQEVASTCEFRPEYACYKQVGVRCERQTNGQCGWTQTPQLAACLQNPPQV